MKPAEKLNFLVCLTKFLRAMNTLFLDSALDESQGKRSPVFRYQNPLVKSDFAESLPRVRRVSRY